MEFENLHALYGFSMFFVTALDLKETCMKRKTLTLKTRTFTGSPLLKAPVTVVAGKRNTPPSTLLLENLQQHAQEHHKVFVQMRNGTGYCGRIDAFDAGCLSISDAIIHGTKNTAIVPKLIIHVLDGSQIAHIHNTESTEIGVTK